MWSGALQHQRMARRDASRGARSMKRLYETLAWSLSLLIGLGSHAFAAERPVEAPWLHVVFEDGGSRVFPDERFDIRHNESFTNGIGVAIKPLDGGVSFPVQRGSALVWFRPHRPLDSSDQWLLFGGWAGFDIHIQANRLIAYATSDHRHHLNLPLPSRGAEWSERWHLLVMSWDGTRVDVNLDGHRIGSRDGVKPIVDPPGLLHIGLLPAAPGRPSRGAFDGRIAELAILNHVLRDEEQQAIHEAGPGEAHRHLFSEAGVGATLKMPRLAWVRGESANVQLRPQADGERMRLWAHIEGASTTAPVLLWQGPVQPIDAQFDTHQLRPGSYRLVADIGPASQAHALPSSTSVPLRILPSLPTEFPVGIDGLVGYPDEILKSASEWGLSFVSAGSVQPENLHSTLERLSGFGLSFFPNLNIHHQKSMDLPGNGYFDATGKGTSTLTRDVLQTLVHHGDETFTPFSWSLGSPFSPVARKAMRDRLDRLLDAAGDHPGLLAVSFDDEYMYRVGTDSASGLRYYGDYSAAARRYFADANGGQAVAPFPPNAPPGTVFPDNLPYFRWRDIIGMPGDPTTAGLSKSWAILADQIRSTRPSVVATTWSGGEHGEVDVVMDYAYPVIWEPRPHFTLGHGRLDFIIDRHRARQRHPEQRPVWGLLGWWSHDLSNQPDWCVEDFRLNTVLALAKGVKGINWHTTWPPPKDSSRPGSGLLSRPDLRDELIHWTGWLKRQGPMYARLVPPGSGNVAVLWSEDDRAGKVYRENQPLQLHWFYAAMRAAGYSVSLVTDDDVAAGELDNYDALVLTDFDFASESLWHGIQTFAATPRKRVIVDQGTALRPGNAIVLPFHHGQRGDRHTDYRRHEMPPAEYQAWMTNQLRQALVGQVEQAALTVQGSDYVAPYLLDSPDGRLLTLVNYNLTEPQRVTVSHQSGDFPWIYDVDSGPKVRNAFRRSSHRGWTVEVPKAGAARFLLLNRPVANIDATLSVTNHDFVVRVAVVGSDAGAIRFPFPIKVALRDPAGNLVTPYTYYSAVDAATGRLELRIPRSQQMDGDGVWSVSAEELLLGLGDG